MYSAHVKLLILRHKYQTWNQQFVIYSVSKISSKPKVDIKTKLTEKNHCDKEIVFVVKV